MAKKISLTLAFIDKEPLAAGRVLAAMSAEQAATFLDAIPTRLAAPVVTSMGAWSVAPAISLMSTPGAAGILRAVDYLVAVAILRSLTGAGRVRVLSDVSGKLLSDFETSLAFPDDTVGASMTLSVLALSAQHLVSDAIDLMRHSPADSPDVIIMVDADRKLTGLVQASCLWRHAGETPLAKIMDNVPRSISARARLAEVYGLVEWADYPALPVVSRQRRVIGLLKRSTAVQSTDRSAPGDRAVPTSIPASLLEAYFFSFVGMARVLSGVGASPKSGRSAGHE